MGDHLVRLALAVIICVGATVVQDAHARAHGWKPRNVAPVQLGPRPFYLVEQLSDGELKRALQRCAANTSTYEARAFSIGHRGAALQFPEHTKESYEAAARMGAGIVECDVTFTGDAELVCRHAQCDLHATTNILATPLAAKCEQGFEPAQLDAMGKLLEAASAKCCTSALTLEEFLSLEGKMDAANSGATTVTEYLRGTADFRTDLYATGATLLSHVQSIALLGKLGTGFTPELKGVDDAVGFGDSGLNQASYARKMIKEYIEAGVDPRAVWAQSFHPRDVLQWIKEFPRFGRQAVLLDGRKPATLAANPPEVSEFEELKRQGVNIIAPPMPVLLHVKEDGSIVPSPYAMRAKQAGLDMISWTAERSGRIVEEVLHGKQRFYYQSTLKALQNDGDILRTIHVLAQDVGIVGLFSDWPATTTFYANCMDTKAGDGRSWR